MSDAALFHQHRHAVARYLPGEQGENLYLVQRLLRARWRGLLGRAQRFKKCLACACGLEALEKILRWREINPALLDQLRPRLVSESSSHHVADLLLSKGLCQAGARRYRLLLRPNGKRQNHRYYED